MNPFAAFALEPRYDLDERELERRYRDLQKQLHPDRHAKSSPSERRASLLKTMELNEAYRVLKDDLSRGEALLKLLGYTRNEESGDDPAFLMEMMELREELAVARKKSDLETCERLLATARSAWNEAQQKLRQLLESSPTEKQLTEASRLLNRLRFYRRMIEEAETELPQSPP